MILAFQPSLAMLGMVLAGLWLERFFLVLGLVGAALIALGMLLSRPWLTLWMAVVPKPQAFIIGD